MSIGKVDSRGARRSLSRLAENIADAATKALTDAVEAGKTSARETKMFQDRTGGTRRSIVGDVVVFGRLGARGTVVARGAAIYLENGTRPHDINRSVLIPGVGWRYIKRHPGTFARSFMSEARNVASMTAAYRAETYTQQAIARYRAE